ncbi:putative lysine-specific demethylase ELF6 [Sesamum angolense]|uniref:Lysine-specific demethylase ELF6 n=2 Tax=Sesamum TaxID=4181 RepID=A0AAE1X270_9LAMI|nr:putative lysine-specific demethylase ELF6 [Sesamum angolense]
MARKVAFAPEFRPTDTEFADPIAYISKIEKEASAFGICKAVLQRHQELGCEKGKRVKGADGDHGVTSKAFGKGGGVYAGSLNKGKEFAKSQLGMLKEVNPLVIEAMFWKAASEKPIYVEYANDVPGSAFETASNSLLSNQSHHGASFSGRKDFEGADEMEGTAGWKLSNCPWNLQVIARSPGSLTRFMPDDIPGVTSPMIYIGMLFSWFAWHVEDHELHSLNFLHMGSAKTWYAVPGDYAFNFEETVRLHGYGGNADRLVALSLLGEKTTVLSPEIIVASGIPCCRLVQNPGEFVVTFPRAYHIGFSHGFNCGEAANFGTPKWLTIAKEAAVRRAAMNYLPMLSHQQLLYLLTMSFISRSLFIWVLGILLDNGRSGVLNQLQGKGAAIICCRILESYTLETDQWSVSPKFKPFAVICISIKGYAKSFGGVIGIKTLGCALLVLWDVESMPSSSKESEPCKETDTALTSMGKDSSQNNDDIHDLSQLSKYIGAVGFDLNDDDLAYDFQIESGTLPCIACGILGFPFMAVVQPSEVASTNLLMDPLIVSAESGQPSELNPVKEGAAKGVSLNLLTSSVFILITLFLVDFTEKTKLNKKDLHHVNEASSVAETSQSTHQAVEQASVPSPSPSLEHEAFSSQVKIAKGWNISNVSLKPRIFCLEHAIEIEGLLSSKGGANVLVICHSELSNGSPEDLNLIDFAIDREEQVDCAEDWTSKLSINLQHCVKVKKNSPSKNVQHLLSLGGLFCDATPISNASGVKWLSRKLRSKRHLKRLFQNKRTDMNTNEEHQMAKKDVKIIQYSRKRYKSRASAGIQVPIERPSALPFDSISESLRDHPGLLSGRDSFEKSFPSHHGNSVMASTPCIENVEAQKLISPPNELAVSENVGSTSDENGIGNAAEDVTLREEETMDESTVATKACDQVAETDLEILHNVQSDGDDLTNEASEHGGSSNCSDDEPPRGHDEQMGAISDQLVTDSEVSKSSSSERQQHIERDGDNKGDVVSGYSAGIHESTSVSTEECLPGDTHVDVASHNDNGESVSLLERKDSDDANSIMAQSSSIAKTGRKRKQEVNLQSEDYFHVGGFIRGPCEGLRPRAREVATGHVPDNKKQAKETPTMSKVRKATDHSVPRKDKKENQKGRYKCELDGCTMSFQTKAELLLHKGNRCPVEGCRKKFNSHKYAIQHQRVHDDDRPLKCPWDGCTMSFKWAWARTEHLRVHTGERPYVCKVKGCGLTFRFVSDFSRHRRKTGHYVSPPA